MRTPPITVRAVGLKKLLSTAWYQTLVSAGAPRSSVPFTNEQGVMSPSWYRHLTRTSVPGAPQITVAAIDQDRRMSQPWYTYLSRL